MPSSRKQSGFFIQSTHGVKGNFELISPRTAGGFAHYWRNNDLPSMPWNGPFPFGSGTLTGVSLIQSNFGAGNLEVIGCQGNQLVAYWRLGQSPWTWHGPFTIAASGVVGHPGLIQSNHGTKGNFEVVVPRAGGGLAHYWRNNDLASLPWSGPTNFGSGSITGVSLIQSNFGAGNLEVIARQGNNMVHYWRLGQSPWTWHGPFTIATGINGTPSMIQSKHGTKGNFELVMPRVGGGLAHYWRNNDLSNLPWSGPTNFGTGNISAVSLIQSNYGAGNLEVIAREGNRLAHYWRLGQAPWTWHGPFYIGETECLRVHVKILTPPNIPVNDLIAAMQQVYDTANIRVVLASTENLNLPALNDLDVGGCFAGQTTTEQNQLFANRNNAAPDDVVVYFVRSTVPPYNGCAAHPTGRPGAVCVQGATRWTFAHEIGHVLGLAHVNDNNRLMTGNGTANITNPPPDLVDSEVSTMRQSNLTRPC